jgi:uncharacterized protein YqgC (DUF456 family)
MLVGLLGIVVPVLPGLLLTVAATAMWAFEHPDPHAWVVFWVALALCAVGVGAQYLLPGRRMRRDGVGTPTLLLAVALALVGFFAIPVVGAFVGFVLGIFLVEYARKRDPSRAWTSTKSALTAVLHSMGIELLAGLAIVTAWVVGVLVLGVP